MTVITALSTVAGVFIIMMVCFDTVAAIEQDDYYSILGISQNASRRDVKKAYRKLSKQYHPDKNKSPDAEQMFISVSHAYEVLSNPLKRREYDQIYRFRGGHGASGGGGGGGAHTRYEYEDGRVPRWQQMDPNFNFRDAGELFRSFFDDDDDDEQDGNGGNPFLEGSFLHNLYAASKGEDVDSGGGGSSRHANHDDDDDDDGNRGGGGYGAADFFTFVF